MASAPFETEEGPRRATVLRYPTPASESGQPSSLAAASSRAQPINPSRRQRRTDKPAPTLETGHENHIALPGGLLEASVRSRGTGVGRRRDCDLIEAGLSEPAGWRARPWGARV